MATICCRDGRSDAQLCLVNQAWLCMHAWRVYVCVHAYATQWLRIHALTTASSLQWKSTEVEKKTWPKACNGNSLLHLSQLPLACPPSVSLSRSLSVNPLFSYPDRKNAQSVHLPIFVLFIHTALDMPPSQSPVCNFLPSRFLSVWHLQNAVWFVRLVCFSVSVCGYLLQLSIKHVSSVKCLTSVLINFQHMHSAPETPNEPGFILWATLHLVHTYWAHQPKLLTLHGQNCSPADALAVRLQVAAPDVQCYLNYPHFFL